ncbi:MAG TPA: translocation/assembly module TamB domain-containing protein [Burkholderiales bacterium]|nr:translocation/assembly module TamB domain-containing protein [Burkholderiales bacterium]
MRRAALVAALLLAAVLASAAGAAAWLLYTESGLAWLATRVAGIAGKGLTLDGVAGTLVRGARIAHIRYAGEDIEINASDAVLAVSPWSLARFKPRIEGLGAREISVTTKPTEPRDRPPDTLELPVSFELAGARVDRLVVDLGGRGAVELSNLALDYEGGSVEHTVKNLTVDALGYALTLQGSIAATAPFPLRATLKALRRDKPPATLAASAHGTLTKIALEGNVASGTAQAGFTAHLTPYDRMPLDDVTAHGAHLDLAALMTGAPRTALDLDLAFKRTGDVYAGSVRATNTASGPYDRGLLPLSKLNAELRTDGKLARFSAFTAELGKAGTVTGSGTVTRESAELRLRTKRLDLAGMHTQLRATALAGEAEVKLTQARQSIVADLVDRDIALKLTAHKTGSAVDVPQFVARARGGEARGAGKIDLAGRKAYSVEATLARFDPAAWGRFPAGTINGTLQAKGTIAGPEVDASFVVRDSRWLNAPLAGRGVVALSGERLREIDLDATLGGNSIVAKGALGLPNDTLQVRFDAPRLAIVHPRLAGSARGNVELTGAWRAPGVRFEVSASDLAYERAGQVKSLSARGTLSTRPDGPFEVAATLRGLATREAQLREAVLNVKGTRAAHTGTVTAQGERVDFRARANGGWRENVGWSGTVEELVNQGEAAVRLTAPVRITVGPQRAQSDAFELRVIGGTLAVKQLSYDHGRLATSGRFSDLPLRPVLTMAGIAPAMAGTLRLNGGWTLHSAPQLTGSISVSRQSGDVALGIDRSIALGLSALTLDVDIREDRATMQARLRSALASASAQGRASPVAGRYRADSPIDFSADVDIARLAPFAAFIDTTLLIEGEAHARLQGRGTLSDPQITGPVTADKIAIALPAEGIDLKGGTLKAQLAQKEIRVESFSIRGGEGTFTAEGTLARTGFDEASVDWRAERFTVLSRPDRRLVLSGKGNAALRTGKLAFTGNLRADEGVFELVTRSLPTLGDDVVIVGRAPVAAEPQRPSGETPPEPRKLARASVDIGVDLGNNVHVKGRGLDVWLSGQVKVQTNARGEIIASGTVDARRGTYTAYGQRLDISRGRLFFSGPLFNPALDILAVRRNLSVEPGVQVSGTLQRPIVRVVSTPSLPEGEALSWLVLGHAPSAGPAGQSAALPLAATAIAGGAGAPIARRLHLDEIGMRSGNTVSDQFVTVGKRVTDKLYVMFEQSVNRAETVLRLEYALTQRVALRAQAGVPSSFGVFYRYGWD